MITTGKQTTDQGVYTPLDIASSRLQSKGAAVFVLGIGKDVDSSELSQIASEPNNVFRVDSFKDLYNKANEAKRGICILGNGIFYPVSELSKYIFILFIYLLSIIILIIGSVIIAGHLLKKKGWSSLHDDIL